MEVWGKARTHLFPQSRAETPMQDPSCTLPARGPQRSPGSPQSPARLVHCSVCTGEQGPTQRINCLCEINNETTESPLCSPDGKDKQSPPAHATPHGHHGGPSCWVSKPKGGGEPPLLKVTHLNVALFYKTPSREHLCLTERLGAVARPVDAQSGPAGWVTDPAHEELASRGNGLHGSLRPESRRDSSLERGPSTP